MNGVPDHITDPAVLEAIRSARSGEPITTWGHTYSAAPGNPWWWADPCVRCDNPQAHDYHRDGVYTCPGRDTPWQP